MKDTDKVDHSDTIRFLRALLADSRSREDRITIWLMVGISCIGLFFVAAIIYLVVVGVEGGS